MGTVNEDILAFAAQNGDIPAPAPAPPANEDPDGWRVQALRSSEDPADHNRAQNLINSRFMALRQKSYTERNAQPTREYDEALWQTVHAQLGINTEAEDAQESYQARLEQEGKDTGVAGAVGRGLSNLGGGLINTIGNVGGGAVLWGKGIGNTVTGNGMNWGTDGAPYDPSTINEQLQENATRTQASSPWMQAVQTGSEIAPMLALPALRAGQGLSGLNAVRAGLTSPAVYGQAAGLGGMMSIPAMQARYESGEGMGESVAKSLAETTAMLGVGKIAPFKATPVIRDGRFSPLAMAEQTTKDALTGGLQGGAFSEIAHQIDHSAPSHAVADEATFAIMNTIGGARGSLAARSAYGKHREAVDTSKLNIASNLEQWQQTNPRQVGPNTWEVNQIPAAVDRATQAAQAGEGRVDSPNPVYATSTLAAPKYGGLRMTEGDPALAVKEGGIKPLSEENVQDQVYGDLATQEHAARQQKKDSRSTQAELWVAEGDKARDEKIMAARKLLEEERAVSDKAELDADYAARQAAQNAPTEAEAPEAEAAPVKPPIMGGLLGLSDSAPGGIGAPRLTESLQKAVSYTARTGDPLPGPDTRQQAIQSDPGVVDAQRVFDTWSKVAPDLPQTLEAARALAQAKQKAVSEFDAVKPERPIDDAVKPERPIDTGAEVRSEVPVEVGSERPAPNLDRSEVQHIIARLKSGEITPKQAMAEHAALKKAQESNATQTRPQTRPQTQEGNAGGNTGRLRNDVLRRRDIGVSSTRESRVPREGEVGTEIASQEIQRPPAKNESQGQNKSGSTQEPVEGRRDQVPQPEVKPVATEEPFAPGEEKVLAAASGLNPTVPIHATHADVGSLKGVVSKITAGGKRALKHLPEGLSGRVRSLVDKMPNMFGAFKGGKLKSLARMVGITYSTMSQAARDKITHTFDLFGGSGSAGLAHRLLAFNRPGVHTIRELDPHRLAKIRLAQTEGTAFGKRAGRLMSRVLKEIIEGEGMSGGGLVTRLERKLNDILEAVGPTSEMGAAARLYLDVINRRGQGKEDEAGNRKVTPERLVQDAHDAALRYTSSAKKLADEAKAAGIEIKYENVDGYTSEVPSGDHVHVIMDPPYFSTSGYPDFVGSATYKKTVDRFAQLQDQGNHVMYTDEAWWGNTANPGLKKKGEYHEGSKLLDRVVGHADTVDTHTVERRTETIMTSDGSKTREVRAKEAEVKKAEASAAPAPVETKALAPTAAEVAHEGRIAERVRTIKAALKGKAASETSKAHPHAPIGLHDMDVRHVSGDTYEVFDPVSKDTVATVTFTKPITDVNPRSWFESSKDKEWFNNVFHMANKGHRGTLPTTAEEFLSLPSKVRDKMIELARPSESYNNGDEVLIHVKKGAEINAESYSVNHGLEHFVVTRKLSQGERDTLLEGMRKRGIKGVDKMSSNPKDGDQYTAFLEAVRDINEGWQSKDLARKLAHEQSGMFGAVMRKLGALINHVKTKLGFAVKAAANMSDDGVDVIIKKLRSGSFDKTKSKPAEESKSPSYATSRDTYKDEDGEEGDSYLSRRNGLGILSDATLPMYNKISEILDATADQRRVSMEQSEEAANKYIDRYHDGSVLNAAKTVGSSGQDAHVKLRVLEAAANKIAARRMESPKNQQDLANVVLEGNLIRSQAGRDLALSKAKEPETAEERRAEANVLAFAPTVSEKARAVRLKKSIAGAANDVARARHEAAFTELTESIAKRGNRMLARVAKRYGVDINGEESSALGDAVSYATVRDIMAYEAKKEDVTESALAAYKSSMLSSVLRTQGQQLSSNITSLITRHGPLQFLEELSRTKNPIKAWQSGNTAQSFFTKHVWKAAFRNLKLSMLQGENANIYKATGRHVGSGEHDMAAAPVWAEVLTAAPFRVMAGIDGFAQQASQIAHEAQMTRKLMLDKGSSREKADEVHDAILSGRMQAHPEIQLDAMYESTKTTAQHTSTAHPEARVTSDMKFIDLVQRFRGWADHAVHAEIKGKEYRLPLGTLAGLGFIRTPVAYARQAVSMFPPAQAAIMAKRYLAKDYEGARGQKDKYQDYAHLWLGLSAAVAVGAFTETTGTYQDKEQKKRMLEGHALSEYTMKVMGIEIPYGRVPFASAIASYANIINDIRDGKFKNAPLTAIGDAVAPFLRLGENLAFFSSIDDIRKTYESNPYEQDVSFPDRFAKYTLDRLASAYPALWRDTVKSLRGDVEKNIYPDADLVHNNVKDSVDAMVRYLGNKTGTRKTEKQYNAEGDTIDSGVQTPFVRTLSEGALGPSTKIKPTEIDTKIEAYRKKTSGVTDENGEAVPVKMPGWSRSFTFHKTKTRMTDEEFSQFQKAAGATQKEVLTSFLPALEEFGADLQGVRAINKLIAKAHDVATRVEEQKLLEKRRESIVPIGEQKPE